MSTIRFVGVTRRYPGQQRPAVDDCSFEVTDGSLVVLLGPSGCGKTTLLKMVNRLIEPSAGQIFLDGIEIGRLNVSALRRQIGYVIQQGGLFPHMTVAKNIAVVPELLHWPQQKIAARVDELLELVDLPATEYRHRYPAQMSGGQQQRVGLARALAGDPKVLLMDEPFGAIDAITRISLQTELLHLQRKLKKTILFVTHDVDEALRLAGKIAIIRSGKLVQYDTPFKILQEPANDFVAELVGADDAVRRLSLLPAESAMLPLPPGYRSGQEPVIAQDESLRAALSVLLASDAAQLTVVNGRAAVGVLTMDQIRAAARDGRDG